MALQIAILFLSIFLSIDLSIYLSIRPSIYLFILRTWFFTGSQSPKSQMQVEGPCFPSSAAQRSWNSAQQQNSDASGWQLQQGMYCWPQQWKDRPRSYGTKLLSTTHPPQGLPQPKVAMAKSMLIPWMEAGDYLITDWDQLWIHIIYIYVREYYW